jgi:hypothetical protein
MGFPDRQDCVVCGDGVGLRHLCGGRAVVGETVGRRGGSARLTALNYRGVTKTAIAARVLVAETLAVLVVVVAALW